LAIVGGGLVERMSVSESPVQPGSSISFDRSGWGGDQVDGSIQNERDQV
jgi:hypothetical protein